MTRVRFWSEKYVCHNSRKAHIVVLVQQSRGKVRRGKPIPFRCNLQLNNEGKNVILHSLITFSYVLVTNNIYN